MLIRCGLLALTCACVLPAAVKKVDITERSPVLDGAYEKIAGKVYFAVDPKLAPNKIIADIDLAPTNADGMVEFSSDLFMLQPKDPAKRNGTALVEISNRGGKGLLTMFDYGAGSANPTTEREFGDKFLLEQGYTLVWIGWEFDVGARPGVVKLYAPIASDHGKAITGLVRAEWVGDKSVNTINLGDRTQVGYPVADANDPANQILVRATLDGERHALPRDSWTFSDPTHVTSKAGFEPGAVYEVIYRAKDPVLVGLGPAAVRDFASYLKYDQKQVQRTLAFGVSQSGRFLRTFLYDGFNQDEKDRPAFDGVWAHVAGGGRGAFNARFAQASRDGHPYLNILYAIDLPPFDENGLLAKARAAHVTPKLFLSNTSYEYWGRAASLIHTTPDGKADVAPSPSTRIYFLADNTHGSGAIPPSHPPELQNIGGAVDYRPAMRALLVAMNAWLSNDTAPPPSKYPEIAHNQLVAVKDLAFPHIPGVALPAHKREAYDLDFSTEPPKLGHLYPTLVPQVDNDGNEPSGIRLPEVAVPLATYLGWNLRSKAIGAPTEIFSMVGSFIPFPVTDQARAAAHDPRASIDSRYATKRDFLEKYTAAAQALVSQHYLLEQDMPRLREMASREWDYVLTSK